MTTALAEPSMTPDREAAPRPYHWAADDFERACESGAFGHDRRLELVHGKVIEHMPQSSFHANVVEYLADCLRAALSPRFRVRDEKPIRIAFDGDPVPDVSVVTGPVRDMRQPHPTPNDVALLVEVAVSSADYDLGEKALLYAQAGITDYWVVLPERNEIVVHREPTASGYGSVVWHGEQDTLSPLAASDVALTVRDLLGRRGKTEED